MELHRAVALVTGGGRGIGEAIARRLSAAGLHVVVSGRDVAALDAVASDIAGVAIPADLSDRSAAEVLIRTVEREVCRTRYEERLDREIDGYRVTYRYNGRDYRTQLPYEPGERLRVRVAVDPVGG